MPDKANDIYDNKTEDYFQYCDHGYPMDKYNKVLEANKLYRFMFYQAFRNQKKGESHMTEDVIQFDSVDYEEITQNVDVGKSHSQTARTT